jgi:hypothetical protein
MDLSFSFFRVSSKPITNGFAHRSHGICFISFVVDIAIISGYSALAIVVSGAAADEFHDTTIFQFDGSFSIIGS